MSWNDESKIGHPVPGQGVNETPRIVRAPPAPPPSTGSTLPNSSVPIGELEKAASDAFASRGIPVCAICGAPAGHGH